ncbi:MULTISPECIES: hypothetical protein [unclassified Pseudofrankia]|uniref:hypothetical protein n=1 Tax=unclassified Pseudofrankia TaxID=2994372 RepID=UPI0008DA9B4F|nr:MULTISPECIES: hypothetical protein [unclassified Pseudofrankia]MDT3445043.1 hypothetical protein [Pseudofrankia sp. BMG5.37]OHV47194.1 hypothetical protein BCD48_19225 [Pseudofrankia sp. BMG5.36]
MPDSAVLQVLIGLALVFAVFSVAVSRVNEAVLGFFNYRGRQLEAELRRLASEAAHPAAPSQDGAAPPRDITAELMDGPLRAMRTGGGSGVPAVAAVPPARGWLGAVRRARDLRLPTYVSSTAFARAVLEMVEPPARALLHRASPAELAGVFPTDVTDEQRAAYAAAYRAAYDGLTPATAQALHTAMPASCESGRAVTTAIVALLAQSPDTAILPLGAEIALLPESPLKTALTAAAARVGADRDKLVAELAQWYDAAMDRLSGWYKRRVGKFLLVYAVVLTVAFNLDAIGLTRALWQDSALRAVAVASAETRAQTSTPADADGSAGERPDETKVSAVRDIGALQLPFGWTRAGAATDPRAVPDGVGDWALKALGWLVTVAALTAGAPFWFDLLGRLVNMRSTGPKPKPAAAQ